MKVCFMNTWNTYLGISMEDIQMFVPQKISSFFFKKLTQNMKSKNTFYRLKMGFQIDNCNDAFIVLFLITFWIIRLECEDRIFCKKTFLLKSSVVYNDMYQRGKVRIQFFTFFSQLML